MGIYKQALINNQGKCRNFHQDNVPLWTFMKSTVFLRIVALSSFLECGEQPGTKSASSLMNAFTLSRRSFSLLFLLDLKHKTPVREREWWFGDCMLRRFAHYSYLTEWILDANFYHCAIDEFHSEARPAFLMWYSRILQGNSTIFNVRF